MPAFHPGLAGGPVPYNIYIATYPTVDDSRDRLHRAG
jgi:hypothetical protein